MLQPQSNISCIIRWTMSARLATSPHRFSRKRAAFPLVWECVLGQVSHPFKTSNICIVVSTRTTFSGSLPEGLPPQASSLPKICSGMGYCFYRAFLWLRSFDMVSDPRKQDVVSWSPDGRR